LQLPSLTDPALEQLLVPLQLYHENLKNKASLESFNNTVTCDRAQRKQTETKPEIRQNEQNQRTYHRFHQGGQKTGQEECKNGSFHVLCRWSKVY